MTDFRMVNDFSKRSGQTLIEAIVAIGILATAILSALTLTTLSLSAEQEALAAVVGGNLAREGVEAARTIRDSNWLAGKDFNEGLRDEGAGVPKYTGVPVMDPNTGAWTFKFFPPGQVDASTRVYRQVSDSGNATTGLYRQSSTKPANSVDSGYSRIVDLHPICVDAIGTFSVKTIGKCTAEQAGVRVTSTVTWKVSGRAHKLVVQENMYDWR